jgi:O-antigen ligase
MPDRPIRGLEHALSIDSPSGSEFAVGLRYGCGRSSGFVAATPAAAANSFATWLILVGVFTPATMTIYVGGAKFIPGRIVICLFLVPALLELFRKGRHLAAVDAFACLASAWMIAATLQADQESWSSAAAMVLEFLGGYLVARAYFFGEAALRTFVHVLKRIAVIVILLAIVDHLAGRMVTYNAIASLWGLPTFNPEFRNGLLRAFSTFPHPILYGTFCVVSGTIFLYSERTLSRRILYAGWCFLGCILAMSSAPLLSFMMVIATYCYDVFLRRYRWRWQALIIALSLFLLLIFVTTNKPVSWLVSHLTLDPSTGYFRVATWDMAFYYIGLSPVTGYGFQTYASSDDFFGNASVDSVWLSLALRFGIPVIVLIVLTNVLAFWKSGPTSGLRPGNSYMNDMRTAFTLTLVVYMFAGLTVHYWNNIWIFWGICLGIRASLQEEYASPGMTPAVNYQRNVQAGRAPYSDEAISRSRFAARQSLGPGSGRFR